MSRTQAKTREFKTADIFSMIALVGVVATLSGVVLARSLDDDRPTRTRLTAEALSLQLLAQLDSKVADASPTDMASSRDLAPLSGAKSSAAGGGRAPASVVETPDVLDGELSRDPWGRPFHYHVGRTSAGHRRVIVWSDGPNLASDSNESVRLLELAKDLDASSTGREPGPASGRTSFFRGDDIGFVHED